jgi:hypothetical protein
VYDDLKNGNGASFSTKDQDNDKGTYTSCTEHHHNPWWYDARYGCGSVKLNGQYPASDREDQKRMYWGSDESPALLKGTIMMVRPKTR